MNAKLVGIIIGVLALLVVSFFGYQWLSHPSKDDPQQQTAFPEDTQVGNLLSTTTTARITTQDGTPVSTKDFIHHSETVEDVMNPGTYILAGDVGYCLEDGTCPSGAQSKDFSISYDGDYFTIILLQEPMGSARLKAESFLRDRLGVTNDVLCRLNYYLGTPYWVNTLYADRSLGFSFCPGATMLSN